MGFLTKEHYNFLQRTLHGKDYFLNNDEFLNRELARIGEFFLAHFFSFTEDGNLELRFPEQIAESLNLPFGLVSDALKEPVNWDDLRIIANHPCLIITEADPSCTYLPELISKLYSRLGWELFIYCEW